MRRPLLLLLALLALGVAACGDDDDSAAPSSEEEAPSTSEGQAQARPGARCVAVEAPAPRPDGGAEKPSTALEPGRRYVVVMQTSCGEFRFRLSQRYAPKTAASFASLVESGFFDGTVFHRIVPGFVIQGGDPTGTGTGGPGYSTRDVPPHDTAYIRGTVAMAKSGAEPPGTAGSQFFVVTGPDAGLPSEYALLGYVTQGQKVVQAIGEQGDPASGGAGTPLQPVVIEKATLETDGG